MDFELWNLDFTLIYRWYKSALFFFELQEIFRGPSIYFELSRVDCS